MGEERHDQDLQRESQESDKQNKTTIERVEKQDVTKETTGTEDEETNQRASQPVTPDKTADVRPNR